MLALAPVEHHCGIRHDFRNHASVLLAAAVLSKVTLEDLRQLVLWRVTTMMSLVDKMPDGTAPPTETGGLSARFDVNQSVIRVEGSFVCFPRAVTFRSSYEPTSLRVSGDHTEFERGLLNVIENGCAAVAGSDDPEIGITTKAGADYVEVCIADNGHGMDEATRVQIFNAGFTTKMQRSNHGLGLAITAKIMNDLGGQILCESSPGHGASFRMRLPAS